MKFLYLLGLLVFTFQSYSFDNKWIIVDSAQTTRDHYFDLKFSDSLNGMIWNFHENTKTTFRRTTDGGNTWKDVYYNKEVDFADMAFPDKDLFLAVGDNIILRSANQGDTWDTTRIEKMNIYGLFDIEMMNQFYGMLAGCTGNCSEISDMIYFETYDGGKNWSEFQMPIKSSITEMHIFDINTFLIRGYIKINDTIQKLYNIWTHDHWQTFDTLKPNGLTDIYTFINKDICWAGGGYHNPNDLSKSTHQIIHSSDGFKTWDVQLDKKGNGCRILSIKFFDENFGMATSCNALVYYTVNGGKTWLEDKIQDFDNSSPYDYALRHLQMPTKNTAYVISSGTWILKFNGDWTDVDNPDVELTKDISISPNPATDYIDVSVPRWRGQGVDICIFDLLGTEVLNNSQLSIFNSQLRVDVSHLAPGLYFVRVGDFVSKFVKY